MKIHIPTPLRVYAGKQDVVDVHATTVGGALEQLTSAHPELKKHLYTDEGKLRSFVNVYLNDEDVRYLDGHEDAPVTDADSISIIPSIAGGSASTISDVVGRGALAEGTLPELTTDDLTRYSRHLILPEVGEEGPRKLKAAMVLCMGTGGLGAPLTYYLAAAGVGTIGLVDFDVVDVSNLQRQIIHSTPDVGRLKIDSAAEKLKALNPFLNVVKYNTMLTSANALEIFKDFDIVADGTDNFQTRYLVNDACVLSGFKPNVYGSIFRFEGQASVFATEDGPCYRCLYPEPPPPGLVPSCAEGGVLGILPGLVGVIQATEAIKLILGKGEPLIGRLLLIDSLSMRFRELKLRKNPECPLCGMHPTVTKLIDYDQFCGIKPEAKDVPMKNGIPQITPEELKRRKDTGEALFLLDVREPFEYKIANLDGYLLPLGELQKRLGEVDRNQKIVVHCKMGGRSQQAAEFLKQAGYQNVENLAGGITAWSDKVDPSVPKY
jgi:adenylyltransferase/sulfurtransferase